MVLGCRAVALAVLSVLLFAPPAFAQSEPGVTLDPGSPAAKEYALPIEQARRDAGGERDRAKAKAPARAVPSFGEGVRSASATETPPVPVQVQSSGSGDGAATSGKARAKAKAKTKAKAKAKARSTATVTPRERVVAQDHIARALTVASVNTGDSSEGSLVLLLGGSGVLVLGVALGYLLRRRRQA